MSAQRNEAQGYSEALSCLNRRDYSKGIQHAMQYANIRPRDVRVHEVLGKLYEGSKDWKKAIESYKMALQMDPQKTKLGLKVVALYCHLPNENERLRHWTTQVSKKYKDDPIIHRAWECIFKGSKQLDKYADYIRKQLQIDRSNSLFNVKLLECLSSQRKWAEATEQCDFMLDVLHSDEDALQQIIKICEKLSSGGVSTQQTNNIRSSVNLLASLCYLTQAVLGNDKTATQCVDILIRLGQKCTELEPKLNSLDGVFKHPCQNLYMSEFRGQFYYLVGTYLLQLGIAGSLPVNDVLSMTTALYALSLQEEAKRRNNLINMGWMPMHARILSKLSCNRVGQIWHFLRNVAESYGEEYLTASQRRWCNGEGQRDIINQAFGAGRNLQFITMQSFLFSSEHKEVSQSDLDDLLSSAFEVNQESVTSDPQNFPLLVWTCLQWDTRPDGIPSDFGYFVEETFGNLSFSTSKLKIMTIDNLKLLDIEAFLYAVVLVVRAMFVSQPIGPLELRKKNLPLLILKQKLSMKEQEEWFSAIFRLCHSKASAREYSKLRVLAQRGLEVLRCGSNHGNETQLLVQLGRIMNERRSELVKSDGVGDRSKAYHAMSVVYWTGAMGHLKRLVNDGALPRTPNSFFPHVHRDLKNADLKQYMDEGAVVLAEFYSQGGDIQRGLGYLEDVKSSEGLFAKASMFKKLADEEAVPDLEYQLSPTKLTSRGELLDKAKDSLYSTMDSITGRANHPLHEQVKTLLIDIEQEQNDVARKIAEIDGSPSPPPGDESSMYQSFATPSASMHGLATNDPSPQRLASEIRSLNFSHLQMERDRDETRKMLELQNKTLDQNQTMMEQQNKLVEHILNMTPVVHPEPEPASYPAPKMPQQGSGDSDVLRKISEQNEKLFDVMNSMKTQFEDLKRDVVDLRDKMGKLELEQERGKVRELQKQVAASAKPPSQTPVASPAPLQVGMPGATMMPGHKHLYQQSLYHHSGVTYVPHPQYPGYMMPIEGGYHPSMMTSTPSMRRSGTPQTTLPGFSGLYDNGGSPTEEDEELKQQFGKAGPGLGEQREYPDTSGQSLLTSNQYPQMTKLPSSGTPMRGMLGSWQSPSSTGGGSIMSGVASAHSPQTLGGQDQKMDAASTLAAYAAAAAGQRQQLPTMGRQPVASSLTVPKPIVTSVSTMGSQPSGSSLTAPRPIVTSVSTAKPSSQGLLIKSSLTPASQMSAAQPTSKPERETKSPFTGFSFNKAASSSSGFSSSPAFQTPKANAATTSATASPFAGFSFKPSPAKMDNPVKGIGFLGASQPTSDGGSPAQQYPQLTALLSTSGIPNNQEDGNPDSPQPGFYAPSQPSENTGRKPGQSPMSLTTTATTNPRPTEPEKSTVKPQEGSNEDVIFVAERKATPEQIAKAEKLMLPPHFYLYEDSPPCPGCRGCDEEDLKAKRESATDGGGEGSSQPGKGRNLFVENPKGPVTSTTTGLFSNTAFTGLSFASLVTDENAGFIKSDSSKPFSFANAGAQLFGAASKQGVSSVDQEYDPHYEPIISLPEKVDIKTGDEGEEVVFRERSKLYRFDRSTNAWKERGVGEMKILRNPETGLTRILMRREQVLKVCANHRLTPNMKLEQMSSSDCAWVWIASDFSEGEECHEQFAIKFKTPKLAAEFKETFDMMKDVGANSFSKPAEGEEDKENPKEQPEAETTTKAEEETPAASEEDDMSNRFQAADPVVAHPQGEEGDNEQYEGEYDGEYDGEEEAYGDEEYDDYDDEEEEEEDYDDYEEDDCDEKPKTGTSAAPQSGTSGFNFEESAPSLADKFKPPVGSWECDACLIMNSTDKVSCEACSTPKPGTTAPQSGSYGYNFEESKPSLADKFKPPVGSWECDACLIMNSTDKVSCEACSTPKPGTTAPQSGSYNFEESKPVGGPFTISALGSGPLGFQALTTSGSSSFSSNPSAFSAGTSSAVFKLPLGGFSFGQTSQTSMPTAPSSGSGSGAFSYLQSKPEEATTGDAAETSTGTSNAAFKLPVGDFSFGQSVQTSTPTAPSSDSGYKVLPGATTGDAAAGTSTTKGPTPDPYTFVPSSTQESSETIQSDADSTTRNTTAGKPVDPISDQSTKHTPSIAASKLSFGGGMTQFSFGSPNQSKPISGFSFGSSPTDTGIGSKTKPVATGQSVVDSSGAQTAAPVFGNSSAPTSNSAFQGFSFSPKPPSTGDKKEAMSFSELVKSQGQFNFRLDVDNIASSPPKHSVKSPVKSPGLNKSGEYYQDEERDDIYFEPVVTLPDNVKIETGEESEDIKFSHRAKLYRFDLEGSQWKERGVGDIKVLYHPETKKHRIVMRREQVLKVCANHYITEHVDLQPNKGSDRSWVWHAMDVSDGEVKNEQLAVRFKTEDAAKDFKAAVDNAKKGM